MINKLKGLHPSTRTRDPETGFTLLEVMIVCAITLILFTMAVPILVAHKQAVLRLSVEEDVRDGVKSATAYFRAYPNSPEIEFASPSCEGGVKKVERLLATTGSNQTCLSIWGTPTDFYVRASNTSVDGYIQYSVNTLKYERTGDFSNR